jgi:hypothetical protein
MKIEIAMNNYMVRQLRKIALSFRSRLISLSPYLLFFILQFSFFNSSEAQRPKKPSKPAPTVLSVGDLLYNYGLDTTLVNDTAVAVRYLDEQPQNYVDLTNLCVSFRTKAQSAIKSLNDDYTHSDNLIWIDSNIVVSDFGIYEYRLRLFSDFMGRRSIHYSRLEQQRIEAEKEAARLRAEEEARQQQLSRDKEAEGLRLNIERHHRSILSACDGAGISDKAKLKELKDLYYSYLMVYNKYDLSPVQATPASLAQLDELNSFQNDLLENILGENSLPYRIENFKNQLKVRCEKEHSDVYRSYSRVFKQTSVPISFASVSEYQDYIVRLQTVIAVQQRYVQTVELRNTIASNYDAISNLYAKKYKPVFNAYKDVHRTIDQVPAFTTNAQSLNFIQSLSDYIEAQQLYLQYFSHLEDITRRSDTILNGHHENFKDVSRSYRDIQPTLIPLPSFKNPTDALFYEQQLSQVTQVQNAYLQTIELRSLIQRLEDSISDNRKTDRTLWDGYRLLRKQVDLTPTFNTVERARSFITMLDDFVAVQRLCLKILGKRSVINTIESQVEQRTSSFRNIDKAYSRMMKAYDDFDDIANLEDLRRYDRQCDRIIEMQQAFLTLLNSELVNDADARLKRESDISKIKVVIGLN